MSGAWSTPGGGDVGGGVLGGGGGEGGVEGGGGEGGGGEGGGGKEGGGAGGGEGGEGGSGGGAGGGAGGKIGRLTATDSCEVETPRSLATADVTTADVRLTAIASASAAPPLCATVIRASTWSRLVETTVTELAPSSDTFAVSAAPSGSERTTVSSRELLLERARRARCRSCRRSRIIIIMRPLEAVELVATVTTQSGDVSRHAACTSATMVAVSFCELVAVTVIVHSCVRVTLTSAAPLPLALACATAIARRLAATSLELREASSVGSCTSMLKANEIGGNGGGE